MSLEPPETFRNPQASSFFTWCKARELENTLGLSPDFGVWPISFFRAMKGWGWIDRNSWEIPFADVNSSVLSSMEAAASQYRLPFYLRIRGLDDVSRAAELKIDIRASFDIVFDQWQKATDGWIPELKPTARPDSSHSVGILAVDKRIAFGHQWGGWETHVGSMSIDYFNRYLREVWAVAHVFSDKVSEEPIYDWAKREFFVKEIFEEEKLVAWCVSHVVGGHLDIEDLFVRPEHRRKGHGSELVAWAKSLAETKKLPLRFWIPFADAEIETFPALQPFFDRQRIRVTESGQRFAPYRGVLGDPVPIEPCFLPERPAARRKVERRPSNYDAVTDAKLQALTPSNDRLHELAQQYRPDPSWYEEDCSELF